MRNRCGVSVLLCFEYVLTKSVERRGRDGNTTVFPTVALLDPILLRLVATDPEAGDRHDPSGCGLLGGTDADTEALMPGVPPTIDGVVGMADDVVAEDPVANGVDVNDNAPESECGAAGG